MATYNQVKYLIGKYQSVSNLCNLAGIKNTEVDWKLNSCYHLLGRL